MNWWQAIVLGIMQGATEFLPVSSSGHLLLLESVGVGSPNLFFNIMLHVGTLLAVVVAFGRDIFALLRHPLQKYNLYLLLACLPTIAFALVFKLLAPSLIDGAFLGCGFVLTALLLYVGENFNLSKTGFLDGKKAILSGVFQGIAVLPGVSRSGATISSLRLLGVPKQDACRFSFLLSVPIIIGSALFEGIQLATTNQLSISPLPLCLGMAFSFLSGLVSIKFFMALLKKHSTIIFSIYTLLLGVLTTILPLVL